jgi:endoglucanase
MKSFHVDATHYSVANEPIDLPIREPALQAYPNPFSSSANVAFTLPQAADVSLVVYDILGRQRAIIRRGFLPAGEHTAPLKAQDLVPGLYFFHLTTEHEVRRGQMVKVR